MAKLFKNIDVRVTDEDFMGCVTVSVTKAKEVLSGKELDAISEKRPTAKKDEQCRVVPSKVSPRLRKGK